MSQLSNEQLILLDNLIYLNGVASLENIGLTLKQIIEKNIYSKGELKVNIETEDNETEACQTKEEWIQIIKAILNDPTLRNLTLVNSYEHDNEKRDATDDTGSRFICLDDGEGNQTVVIRGSNCDLHWGDNFAGLTESDTPLQKEAYTWVNSLPYTNLTITGHSKGGNLATYCAISDKVSRVLSYDGQGFSDVYLNKYGPLIAANKDKITLIAASEDFVHGLLASIYGEIILIDSNNLTLGQTLGLNILNFVSKLSPKRTPLEILDCIDSATLYHCPNRVLNFYSDESVSLKKEGKPDSTVEFLNDFSLYILEHGTPEQKEKLIKLGSALLGDGSYIELIATMFLPNSSLQDLFICFLAEKYGCSQLSEAVSIWLAVSDYLKKILLLGDSPLNFPSDKISNLTNANANNQYKNIVRDFTRNSYDLLIGKFKNDHSEDHSWIIPDNYTWTTNVHSKIQINLQAKNNLIKQHLNDVYSTGIKSTQEITTIFNCVYNIDANYSKKVNSNNELLTKANNKMTELINSIV